MEEDGPALLEHVDSGSSATGQRSRWSKLRGTIQVANAASASLNTRHQLTREDSFLKKFSTRQSGTPYTQTDTSELATTEMSTAGGIEPTSVAHPGSADPEMGGPTDQIQISRWSQMVRCLVINPDESPMFYWLTITALAVLYNLWACIAREAFPEFQSAFRSVWFWADVLCDVIYVVDIAVQIRTGYLERGLVVYDSTKLALHYVRSRNCFFDVASLTPFDYILPKFIGTHPLIRFPRFLKFLAAGT